MTKRDQKKIKTVLQYLTVLQKIEGTFTNHSVSNIQYTGIS